MVSSLMRKQGFHFMLGICFGVVLSKMLSIFTVESRYTATLSREINIIRPQVVRDEGERPPVTHWPNVQQSDPVHELMDTVGEVKQQHFEDTQHHHDDDSIAKSLYEKVRVACWIMTSPSNLDKKAIHVKNTWLKRCNLGLFMSSIHNESFPTVGLNVSEGRSHLTAKTMLAFKYLYDNHIDDADWFMKADDDTYVIVENLRYLLSDENPQEAVYFGHRFKPYVKQGYTSGGGGYVISREALRRFGSLGFHNHSLCAEDKGAEDVQMGKCLQNLGVTLKSSIDAMRRTRFHCFSPDSMLKGQFPSWYLKYNWEDVGGGMANISDYAITFHYVSPEKMYALEFFTYHLQPYGIIPRPQRLNVHR